MSKNEKKVIAGDDDVYDLLKDAEPIVSEHEPAMEFKRQIDASNESLLARLKSKTWLPASDDVSRDVLELVARFESALKMLAKPQRYYRQQFERASGYKHGSKAAAK